MTTARIAFTLLLLAACTAPPPATIAPKPLRIALIAGPLDSHPKDTHEYERNILLLRYAFERSPSLPGVKVDTYFGWPDAPGALDDADTVVLTSGGSDQRLTDHPLYVGNHFEVLERQVKRGCGVVFLHWSTFHPAAREDAILDWVGGYFDYERGNAANHWYSVIESHAWTTALGTPHPATRGVHPFSLTEEFYFNLRYRNADPRLSLTLLKEAGPPQWNAVGFAVERADGGRGAGFTGGHYYANWWNDDFRRYVMNTIAWTARAEVPANGIETTLEPPLRVLIVTGHDHPAHDWAPRTETLMQALESDPRVQVEATQDLDAFTNGWLSRVDVVVLNYNNWDRPGLSEAQKAGFLAYLDRGGGLAIVHFANGAWNNTLPAADSDWEEYRTKIVRRAWVAPGSDHDLYAPFRVHVGADHEITRGLADFDTTDELYIKQVGDEPIVPLALAHSTKTGADEPVAWAYEVRGARVFQTTLGHSVDSMRAAGPLIRRGVAWAGRKAPLGFDAPATVVGKATYRP